MHLEALICMLLSRAAATARPGPPLASSASHRTSDLPPHSPAQKNCAVLWMFGSCPL